MLLVFLVFVAQSSGCTTGGDSTSPSTTVSPPSTVEIQCLADAECPELFVAGDPPATLPSGRPSPLRGHADPSIRRDPSTGRLWMATSWPIVQVGSDGARSTQVETHLAHSDDDGTTWRADGQLWPATSTPDLGRGGAPGSTDHEVPNLLPVERNGVVTWYAARLDLFVPPGAGLGQRPPSGFRIVVVAADSVPGLATAPTATLGSTATAEGWGIDADLTSLDPGLARCTLWNEPALHADDDELYLVLRCLALGPTGVPDLARSSLEVFSTTPAGDPSGWQWQHLGALAGAGEATALDGDGLTQMDFAIARDGALLAIVTPDRWSSEHREFIHEGVRVLEVDSLDPPTLARDPAGDLIVRATVTAPDLDPLGPAAAAYDAASATGLVLVRRVIGPASLVATMHSTGLHP